MPKFTIEVRDRATIDIKATIEIEADTYAAAIERIETDPDIELEFVFDGGLGWYDQHGESEYRDVTTE